MQLPHPLAGFSPREGPSAIGSERGRAAALGIRPKKWRDGCREGIRSTLDDRSPLTDEFAMDR